MHLTLSTEEESDNSSLEAPELENLVVQATVSGDAPFVMDHELYPIFKDLQAVRDSLKANTDPQGTVRKQAVLDDTTIEGSDASRYGLELLKALEHNGIATSSGRGGGWRYTGGMETRTDRIEAVAASIAELGYETIVAFDRMEPEYETLHVLTETYDEPRYSALLAVIAGFTDFQLAVDAQTYWNELEEAALEHGSLSSIDDINAIIETFMTKPVNARYTEMKHDRIQKVLESSYPDWFISEYPELEPAEIWRRLAVALGGEEKMNSKTVVLAMKILDIHELIVNGSYLGFPNDIDIPVDVHVQRMAESSGITSGQDEETVRTAWAEVATHITNQLGRPVSLLRIDSIVWQFGQRIAGEQYDPATYRDVLLDHADEVGVNQQQAEQLIQAFTHSLETVSGEQEDGA